MSQDEFKELAFSIRRQRRLILIQKALHKLKNLNSQFLLEFQNNSIWIKIYNAMMAANKQAEIRYLVTLQLCQTPRDMSECKDTGTFFNPFEKIPISMCYNRFMEKEKFDKELLYNLVLYYDHATKKTNNWNDLKQVLQSNIRAIHIAGICQKKDEECFKNELERRVYGKVRFQGMSMPIQGIFNAAVEDMTPVSHFNFPLD